MGTGTWFGKGVVVLFSFRVCSFVPFVHCFLQGSNRQISEFPLKIVVSG